MDDNRRLRRFRLDGTALTSLASYWSICCAFCMFYERERRNFVASLFRVRRKTRYKFTKFNHHRRLQKDLKYFFVARARVCEILIFTYLLFDTLILILTLVLYDFYTPFVLFGNPHFKINFDIADSIMVEILQSNLK